MLKNMSQSRCREAFPVVFLMVLGFSGAAHAGGQVLHESDKFVAGESAAGDQAGWSVAIDQGVMVLGTFDGGYNSGSDIGAAFLFDTSSAQQLATLTPEDQALGSLFGSSVAIESGVVVVGAFADDLDGVEKGSAYIFDAASGTQRHKLIPDDGENFDRFGIAVTIENGVVAVGAYSDDVHGPNSGSVYLFDADTGEQLMKIAPDDGAANDSFGGSVAISNGILAVGAAGDDDNGVDSGSAYLFDLSTGAQLAKLHASDGAEMDIFGYTLAMQNNTVVVGARFHDDNGPNSGAAYIFDASTGEQMHKLLPDDGAAGDYFGISVAIDQGEIVVGARWDDDNGINSGSAYLFDAASGAQLDKLLPTDGQEGDDFGWSVDLDNGTVVVGADGDDDYGFDSGSAYTFNVSGMTCPADLTNDGALDFFDVSAFLSLFASHDIIADFSADGVFDFFDISAFLSAFADGCP